MSGRTLLLGLDGATFTVLEPLMRDGVMPFLKGFVAGGVSGELQSVIPALTPPAWTSLTTGRSPGHHGILDFFCKESPESHHIRIATSRDVHAETIWSLADRHGLRATALNFPPSASLISLAVVTANEPCTSRCASGPKTTPAGFIR